jgi:hypothetical protein
MAIQNYNVKNPDPEKYKLALVDPGRLTSLDPEYEVVPAREAKKYGFIQSTVERDGHIVHDGLVLVRRPLTDAEKKAAKAEVLLTEQADRLDELAVAEREATEEILKATATEPGVAQPPELRGAPRLVEPVDDNREASGADEAKTKEKGE